jgi:hypothetical protein
MASPTTGWPSCGPGRAPTAGLGPADTGAGTAGVRGPPLELHHAYLGELGAWRAGPVVPQFEARWAELTTTRPSCARPNWPTSSTASCTTRPSPSSLLPPGALRSQPGRRLHPYRTSFELARPRWEPTTGRGAARPGQSYRARPPRLVRSGFGRTEASCNGSGATRLVLSAARPGGTHEPLPLASRRLVPGDPPRGIVSEMDVPPSRSSTTRSRR